MFRGIINNKFFNAKHINLRNPLKWNCVGFSKNGLGKSFYIPEIDTMIDAGIKLVGRKHMNNYIYPTNLLITQKKEESIKYIYNHIDTQNILYPKTGLNIYNKRYKNIYDGATFKMGNLDIDVKLLYNSNPSYSYGMSYNNEKQLLVTGTTSIDTFYNSSDWKEYPVIMVECANYCDYTCSVNYFRKKDYISWYDLEPIIINNPNIRFILTNSTININVGDVPYIMRILGKKDIDNIYIWID